MFLKVDNFDSFSQMCCSMCLVLFCVVCCSICLVLFCVSCVVLCVSCCSMCLVLFYVSRVVLCASCCSMCLVLLCIWLIFLTWKLVPSVNSMPVCNLHMLYSICSVAHLTASIPKSIVLPWVKLSNVCNSPKPWFISGLVYRLSYETSTNFQLIIHWHVLSEDCISARIES
jgi:hypothetical protein